MPLEGKRILVLERGPFLPREKDNWNYHGSFKYYSSEAMFDKAGEDPTEPWRSKEYPHPPISHESRIKEVFEILKTRGMTRCPSGTHNIPRPRQPDEEARDESHANQRPGRSDSACQKLRRDY